MNRQFFNNMPDSENKLNGKDHDLLIRIDEKLEGVIKEIKTLKDGVNSRITNLESCKMDRSDGLELHEKDREFESRVRRLETLGAYAIGGLFILQLLLQFVLPLFYNRG